MDPTLAATYEAALFDIHFASGTASFDRSGQLTGPPLDEPFAGITAWNPGYERPSATENAAANQRLATAIDARGWRRVPATGRDAANTYAEPSFAVFGATPGDALDLARAFRQAAIFWWDGERLSVLWC